MTILPVTSMTVAAAAVALVALSLPVSLRRMKVGVNTGFGDDEILLRRIRAQGNFIEYTPIGLIVLALLELGGAHAGLVWAVAALLALGRLSHAIGMLGGALAPRGAGMIMTYLSLLAGAVGLVMLVAA